MLLNLHMFVREIKKPNGSLTIAIVESIREGDKVIQKVIRSLGTHKDEREIAIIKDAAKKLIIEMGGKDIPVSQLITNSCGGAKKYLKIKSGSADVNETKIEKDTLWDGLHGVITNKDNLRDVEEILKTYRGLWQIEEAFRITKTDLKIRPVYHWKESRIRAHIAICFMAYTMLVQIRYRLKQKGINPCVSGCGTMAVELVCITGKLENANRSSTTVAHRIAA